MVLVRWKIKFFFVKLPFWLPMLCRENLLDMRPDTYRIGPASGSAWPWHISVNIMGLALTQGHPNHNQYSPHWECRIEVKSRCLRMDFFWNVLECRSWQDLVLLQKSTFCLKKDERLCFRNIEWLFAWKRIKISGCLRSLQLGM